jgi:UDP-N-acetylglucosamine--N-acetylmuramyl-(pentapeptide) pyrophosphoryl-undecaprenol N-acetylglucosamine transferase
VRLALTGGGTGGHILPALTVLEAIRARAGEGLEVRWFGPEDRGERPRIEAAGVRFESIPASPIRGKGPGKVARALWQLVRGTSRCFWRMRSFDADVVFSTGGYGSFPGCVAARLLRKPLVVYLPDVEPGWAVRAERRLATHMATTTEAALKWLPKAKTTVTGYPVRHEFHELTRESARAQLGLAADERVVVIAGATQGAHAINEAVFRGLRNLVEEMTVFHVTGPADTTDAAGNCEALGAGLAPRYNFDAFREDLPAIMVAADVGVMRAGASTLGELPAAGLPAILVPAKYAGGHQKSNAAWLADRGAAVVMDEDKLGGLANQVIDLMNDEDRRAEMRRAACAAAQPDAANRIAELVLGAAK